MKAYLDIPSLIKSDYYRHNHRLTWHIDHNKYDDLSHGIFYIFKNIKIDKKNKELFNISKTLIFHNLCSYLSHLFDYKVLSKKRSRPCYSENSSIYINKIWNQDNISNIFNLTLEKKRLRKTFVKTVYSNLAEFFPKQIVNFVSISKNHLIGEFAKKKKISYLSLSPAYHFPLNLTKNCHTQTLASEICSGIVSFVDNNYFKLHDEHKKSILFIIETYLARTYNDLERYNGFLRKTKNLITGSGNTYYTRLVSTLAKSHGTKVWRFHHGGERCFYDDQWFWDAEFYKADVFVTYGNKSGIYAKSKAKEMGCSLEVRSHGSEYHKIINEYHFCDKIPNSYKILYIPNSFVGEGRQFPSSKIIDPLLFDWQRYLIELLQNNGFDVIYKKHPKGFFQAENILGKIAKYESTKPMIEALHEADIVLCDMAGSAFVEAMCAGKKVILIDTKQRPFHEKNKLALSKFVTIVDAYWEDNILKINEKNLIDSLNDISIDRGKYMEFLNDYYLEGCN